MKPCCRSHLDTSCLKIGVLQGHACKHIILGNGRHTLCGLPPFTQWSCYTRRKIILIEGAKPEDMDCARCREIIYSEAAQEIKRRKRETPMIKGRYVKYIITL